jgi:hypothetical protein
MHEELSFDLVVIDGRLRTLRRNRMPIRTCTAHGWYPLRDLQPQYAIQPLDENGCQVTGV